MTRRIDYEDTGPALEAIAANVYGENWPHLGPGAKATAKQQLLDVFLPGLNVLLDDLNNRLDQAERRIARKALRAAADAVYSDDGPGHPLSVATWLRARADAEGRAGDTTQEAP